MTELPRLPRPGLTVLFLLIALLLGYHLSGDDDDQDKRQGKAAKPHIPSFFVRNLVSTSMDENGDPERHLETSYMVQYFDDETTEMQAPRYQFFRPGQPAWQIQSEQGWMSADGELALLSGRVTILRPASETTAPFKLVTRDLRVQPEDNYLETDHPVDAKSGNDKIDAIGMQAWMGDPGRIKFLSEVKASYVPRKSE